MPIDYCYCNQMFDDFAVGVDKTEILYYYPRTDHLDIVGLDSDPAPVPASDFDQSLADYNSSDCSFDAL